jgi:hypothetical protein
MLHPNQSNNQHICEQCNTSFDTKRIGLAQW